MKGIGKVLICTLALLSLVIDCHAGWLDWFSPPPIVIIKGTSSVPDSERTTSANLANLMDEWLTELALPHKLVSDDEVTTGVLRKSRAVILPYNPNLTSSELGALESAINAGTIVLVFYGQNPQLATLMGIKTAAFREAGNRGQWSGMIFDQSTLPGLPAFVHQTSNHLIPIIPNTGDAFVLARWIDAQGNPTDEPAWIRSPHGFWMSHVLQPGDDENKKQMLLAMLATAIPDSWQRATARLLDVSLPFAQYERFDLAQRDLAWSAPLPVNDGSPVAYQSARVLRATLTRQYSKRQSFNTTFPLRGVWVDDQVLQKPNAWLLVSGTLASNGINAAFLHVGNPLTVNTDDLSRLHSEMERKDVSSHSASHLSPALHAWITCLNLEGVAPDQLAKLSSQRRLQISDRGETLSWLCPSHPANRTLLVATASELARSGLFDGIHLDYIRCKDVHSCFCSGCRAQFEQHQGHAIADWPREVKSGTLAGNYRQWRADQITSLVAAVGHAVRTISPSLKLSAAVYGATPQCFTSVGQDWPGWMDKGLLDFVCPMNYTPDRMSFASLLKSQCRLPCAAGIIPGIGVTASQSRLNADQTAAQLSLVKQAGFHGFVLFDFSPALASDVIPYLNLKGDDQ